MAFWSAMVPSRSGRSSAATDASDQHSHQPNQQHHTNTDAGRLVVAACPDTIRVSPRTDSSHGISLPEAELGRAVKRRKLTHRQQKQTILDTFALPPRSTSPARSVQSEPRAQQLGRTADSVHSTRDECEDKRLRPSLKPARVSRRATQSPIPSQPTQQKKEDKRTLRSQDDGPRLKSELAVYFPNYEDIIFDTPREDEFFTPDTTLYITEESAKRSEDTSPVKATKGAGVARRTSVNGLAGTPATPQRISASTFNGSPSIDLDFLSVTLSDKPEDPLTDEHFLKSHRRAERKEKQLRNIERERSMHEKVQLERLLDGLQGHDWLRVLGITGITEGEAKKFEAKRDYFIAEVESLVDKFRQWKDQEKKLRMEKEAAQAARQAEGGEDRSTESSVEPLGGDINASAARQLQQEAVSALKSSVRARHKIKDVGFREASVMGATTPARPKLMLPPGPPNAELPITSFYDKRHLRDAALSKTRNSRSVLAFGHALPEVEPREFGLPPEYVTEGALRAKARERRRQKRESTVNAGSSK